MTLPQVREKPSCLMTPKLLQAQMKTLAFLALEPARVQDAITPSAPRGLRLAGCGAATFRPPQSCEPMSYNIIYIHTQYILPTHTRVHTRTRAHAPPLPASSVLSLCRALANRDTLSPCAACSSDQDDRAPGCQHSCGPRGTPRRCVVHRLHGRTSAVP